MDENTSMTFTEGKTIIRVVADKKNIDEMDSYLNNRLNDKKTGDYQDFFVEKQK